MEKITIKRNINISKISKKRKIFLFILFIFTLIILIWNMIILKIRPVFLILSDIQARAVAIELVNRVVEEKMQGVNYEDLVMYERNENGEITMLKVNSVLMNNLSSQISIDIQKVFLENGTTEVNLPLGSILNNELLANMRSYDKNENSIRWNYRK